MDVDERLRAAVKRRAKEAGEAQPTEDELRVTCEHFLGDMGVDDPWYNPEEDSRTVWEFIELARKIARLHGGTGFAHRRNRSTLATEATEPAPAGPRAPASWYAHSEQLWNNYLHLQQAALTLLGKSEPMPVEQVEATILRFYEQPPLREGLEVKLLVYPRVEGDFVVLGVIPVYPETRGSEILSRLWDFVTQVATDLACSAFAASYFLLCDEKTLLPWVEVLVKKRDWTIDQENLGIPNLPQAPTYPLTDDDLTFEIHVGSPRVPVKDVAAAFNWAKQEALRRFAGKGRREILGEQYSDSLFPNERPPETGPGRRRYRGTLDETRQMVGFVEQYRSQGKKWDEVFSAWRETGSSRYTDIHSFRNSYYAARKRGA